MMLKGLTVDYLFNRTTPIAKGDWVLFHAGAGGVGLIACQWARSEGINLIATAGSDEKCRMTLDHGAAHAINYRSEDFAARVREITEGRGVDVVMDSVGKDTFEGSLNSLRPLGMMISFGNASGPVPPVDLSGARLARLAEDHPADALHPYRRPCHLSGNGRAALFKGRVGGSEDRDRPALRPGRCRRGASCPGGAENHRLDNPDAVMSACR